MGVVERYPDGTFCWVDLGTNDAAGAKAFYGGLFGWEFDDLPTGQRGTYSTCRLKGRDFYVELFGWSASDAPAPIPRTTFTLGELLVGGGHAPTPGEDPTPRWSVAFWVADADQAAARTQELGGTVLLPPMDIPVGRFTIVADPQGAAFSASAVPGGPARGVDGS
jgi:uncharacterized protein